MVMVEMHITIHVMLLYHNVSCPLYQVVTLSLLAAILIYLGSETLKSLVSPRKRGS